MIHSVKKSITDHGDKLDAAEKLSEFNIPPATLGRKISINSDDNYEALKPQLNKGQTDSTTDVELRFEQTGYGNVQNERQFSQYLECGISNSSLDFAH